MLDAQPSGYISPHPQPSQWQSLQFSQLQPAPLPSLHPQSSHWQLSPQQHAAVLALLAVTGVASQTADAVASAARDPNKNLRVMLYSPDSEA
jgi:hypothetical protein